MKRPTQFRLFGKTWAIEWVKLPGKFGICDSDNCKVKINPSKGEEQQKDTAVHEVWHAISDELGLNMKEDVIRRHSTAALSWLRDNPEVVQWLMETA
jgi:hypothetical protein